KLHVDRFLPPTPVRVIVNHKGKELEERMTLTSGDPHALLEHPELRDLFPFLMESTRAIADERVPGIVDAARKQMSAQLESEIARLQDLQKVNQSVRAEEIELLVRQHRDLGDHLRGARLRLDAIRWIHRGQL